MKKRTADQAQSGSNVMAKLAKILPPTPPNFKRVTPRQEYGTKEHYARRARRLAGLATGLRTKPATVSTETTNTLKRLKDRAGIKH